MMKQYEKFMTIKMGKISGNLDSPIDGEIVGSVLGIQGWILSNPYQDDLIIEVFIDDQFLVQTNYNQIRLDVAKVLPNILNSEKSGFYIEVALDRFEDGAHTIKIAAKTQSVQKTISSKKINLNKQKLLPPKQLREYIGAGDFESVGESFVNIITNHCSLKGDEYVLDIGCGTGRTAIPLAKYLSKGHYDGFDIVSNAIEWNKKYITAQYPHFNFIHSDVYNKHYNNSSTIQASSYTFPYPDEHFDLILLASVFTHMYPKDFEHYLSEISRVLKKNGKCIMTFFLLNDESRNLMTGQNSLINFQFNFDGFSSNNKETPELAIALPEDFVITLLKKYNFEYVEPFNYGTWCGRPVSKYLFGQDIIFTSKK
jgi:ubiquinone/menaquinone biosynthesis C-methylase UbiE